MDFPYPTYDDLVKPEKDIKVNAFEDTSNLKGNDGKGICGGLSVNHILNNLKSSSSLVINPVEQDEIIKASTILQDHCQGQLKCFRKILKQNSFFGTSYISYTDDNPATLDHILKKNIQNTLEDKEPRGVLIAANVSKNPATGKPLHGAHAISMTVRNNNNNLVCTGLDPNFFFVKGKGLSGCNNVAKKMVETTEAYGGSVVRTIETRNDDKGFSSNFMLNQI